MVNSNPGAQGGNSGSVPPSPPPQTAPAIPPQDRAKFADLAAEAKYNQYFGLMNNPNPNPNTTSKLVEELKQKVSSLNERVSYFGGVLAQMRPTDTKYQQVYTTYMHEKQELEQVRAMRDALIGLRNRTGGEVPNQIEPEKPKSPYAYGYDPATKTLKLPDGRTVQNVEGFTQDAQGNLKNLLISSGKETYTVEAKTGVLHDIQTREKYFSLDDMVEYNKLTGEKVTPTYEYKIFMNPAAQPVPASAASAGSFVDTLNQGFGAQVLVAEKTGDTYTVTINPNITAPDSMAALIDQRLKSFGFTNVSGKYTFVAPSYAITDTPISEVPELAPPSIASANTHYVPELGGDLLLPDDSLKGFYCTQEGCFWSGDYAPHIDLPLTKTQIYFKTEEVLQGTNAYGVLIPDINTGFTYPIYAPLSASDIKVAKFVNAKGEAYTPGSNTYENTFFKPTALRDFYNTDYADELVGHTLRGIENQLGIPNRQLSKVGYVFASVPESAIKSGLSLATISGGLFVMSDSLINHQSADTVGYAGAAGDIYAAIPSFTKLPLTATWVVGSYLESMLNTETMKPATEQMAKLMGEGERGQIASTTKLDTGVIRQEVKLGGGSTYDLNIQPGTPQYAAMESQAAVEPLYKAGSALVRFETPLLQVAANGVTGAVIFGSIQGGIEYGQKFVQAWGDPNFKYHFTPQEGLPESYNTYARTNLEIQSNIQGEQNPILKYAAENVAGLDAIARGIVVFPVAFAENVYRSEGVQHIGYAGRMAAQNLITDPEAVGRIETATVTGAALGVIGGGYNQAKPFIDEKAVQYQNVLRVTSEGVPQAFAVPVEMGFSAFELMKMGYFVAGTPKPIARELMGELPERSGEYQMVAAVQEAGLNPFGMVKPGIMATQKAANNYLAPTAVGMSFIRPKEYTYTPEQAAQRAAFAGITAANMRREFSNTFIEGQLQPQYARIMKQNLTRDFARQNTEKPVISQAEADRMLERKIEIQEQAIAQGIGTLKAEKVALMQGEREYTGIGERERVGQGLAERLALGQTERLAVGQSERLKVGQREKVPGIVIVREPSENPKFKGKPLKGFRPKKGGFNITGERSIFADLLSVAKSQAKYGVATHPNPNVRPNIYGYEKGGFGRVPTVELLNHKKKTFKGMRGKRIAGFKL
ncbi:MAG: hypothetical protein PHS46_08405 [Candidatus Omnitrophica bacterium]|nr:hypothetical protein [Candidatus Omnitrophota bacterium]